MNLAAVKTRIKTVLEGVSGVGPVHTRVVNVKEENAELTMLGGDKGRIHFWYITRAGARLFDEDVNQKLQDQSTTLAIHGFYAVKDADDSEAAFDALVDAVLAALNTDRKPAGAGGTLLGSTVKSAEAPQLATLNHIELASPSRPLCHHCEITIAVKEDVQT